MKPLVRLVAPFLVLASVHAADFQSQLGLQLYSLRAQFKDWGVDKTLDLAKTYAPAEIEAYGVADVPVATLAAGLKARGFKVVSTHAPYPDLKKDPAPVIANAKQLGVSMIIVPWLTHSKDGLTEAEAKQYAADFNAIGAACKAAGLRFGYHPHGYEFVPIAKGSDVTAFDVLVRETKPDLVCYEMDVFWAFHGGQDPVKLLNKYPDRWVALHLKDIRKGAQTGLSTGSAPHEDDVTIGTGQIDWPAVLRAAQKIGVKHYFIEDETLDPLKCIPESLKYLRSVKL